MVLEKDVQMVSTTDDHLVFVMVFGLVLDLVSYLVYEKDVQTAVRTDDCSDLEMVFG